MNQNGQHGAISLIAAPARCPECHAANLEAVSDGTRVNFLCRSCTRCWHVEFNRVHRVAPATCEGCPHIDACRARYERDHILDLR